jgi:hypothetical protein
MNISRVTRSNMVERKLFVDRPVIFRLGSRSLRPANAVKAGRPSYRGIQPNGLSLTIDARTVVTKDLVEGAYYTAKAAGNEAVRENGVVTNITELFDIQLIDAAKFEALREETVITYRRPEVNQETGEVEPLD